MRESLMEKLKHVDLGLLGLLKHMTPEMRRLALRGALDSIVESASGRHEELVAEQYWDLLKLATFECQEMSEGTRPEEVHAQRTVMLCDMAYLLWQQAPVGHPMDRSIAFLVGYKEELLKEMVRSWLTSADDAQAGIAWQRLLEMARRADPDCGVERLASVIRKDITRLKRRQFTRVQKALIEMTGFMTTEPGTKTSLGFYAPLVGALWATLARSLHLDDLCRLLPLVVQPEDLDAPRPG